MIDLGPGAGVHGGELVAAGHARRRSPRTPTRSPAATCAASSPCRCRPTRRKGQAAAADRGRRAPQQPAGPDRRTSRSAPSPWSPASPARASRSLVNDILHKALARHFFRAGDKPGRARPDRRPRAPRQGDRHRPEPDRPHAALEPGDLHQRLQPHPQPDGDDARGARARLPAGPLQLQRQGRALRGLRRRRADQDRDALPARHLRHLRGLRRQALRPRDAGGALQGARTSPRSSTCRSSRRATSSAHIPAIERILATLDEVGLGYIHLGQSATTLSGGEAQRVKLATELCKRSTGRPSTCSTSRPPACTSTTSGSCSQLLHRLVELGNTVIVIEHNLDVIKTADWVIDLGPDGGGAGGRLVAEGPPRRSPRRRQPHRPLPRPRARSPPAARPSRAPAEAYDLAAP